MVNAIQVAIRTETDAIAFYQAAAEKTNNPVGKKMFLSIVEDERNHLEDFKGMLGTLHTKEKATAGQSRKKKTSLGGSRSSFLRRMLASTDELEALKVAMQMEKKSIQFYQKLLRGVKTPRQREIFDRLVKEEQQHYNMFSNTYFFLSNSENWFLWEEHSIADGGTAWA